MNSRSGDRFDQWLYSDQDATDDDLSATAAAVGPRHLSLTNGPTRA